MKSFLLSSLRLLRGILVTAVAVAIIGAAVVVGAGRLLVPYADHLRPQFERVLADRIGREVTIARLEATWGGLTPVLELQEMRVGEASEQPVTIERLQLEFRLRDLFVPKRSPLWMVFDGVDVTLVEQDNGRWTVGVDAMAFDHSARADLAALDVGNLLLADSRLRLDSHTFGQRLFELPEVRVQLAGGTTALSGYVRPAATAKQAVELRLIAELDGPELVAIEAWAGGRDLAAHDWLGDIPGVAPAKLFDTALTFQNWLEWRAGETAHLSGDLVLTDWPAGAGASTSMNAHYALERDQAGTQLDITELRLAGEPALQRLNIASDGRAWGVAADQVDLGSLHTLVKPWLDERFPEYMDGRIESLAMTGDMHGSLQAARGRIRALTVAPVAKVPGFEGLDLDLGLEGDLLAIDLGGQQPVVDWSGMLRAPVELASLAGRVLLGPELLVMENVAIEHPFADATANGLIAWTGRQPFLDFRVDVPRYDISDPRPYLPVAITPDPVLAWLDHALPGRQRGSGRLQFFGRPRDWPWDAGEGEFLAEINFTEGTLGIFPGWPGADTLEGQVVFAGRGMQATATDGRINGMSIARADARIADFKNAELELGIDAPDLPADALLDFFERAPILEDALDSNALAYAGPVSVDLALVLPMKKEHIDAWSMSGRVESDGMRVRHAEGLFRLDEIRGAVDFSRERVGPADLTGRLNDGEVTIRTEGVPGQWLSLTLAGELALPQLIPPAWHVFVPEDLPAMGASDWRITLDHRGSETRLHATSDLIGTALALPAPLEKPAQDAWALSLEMPVKADIDHFALSLGEDIALAAQTENKDWRWGLGLGGEPAVIPEDVQFQIRGMLEKLDLSGWMRTAGTWMPTPGPGADHRGRALLRVDDLRLGTRGVSDVTLNLHAEEPYWLVDVVGTGASGQVRLPATEHVADLAVVDFQHLRLSEPLTPEEAQDDEDQEADNTGSERQVMNTDPRNLPGLHVLVEDLQLGDLNVGRVRVEAHNSGDGLEIETVQVGEDALRLSGQGRWVMRDGQPVSDFSLRLNFLDARHLMRAAGIEANLDATSGQIALVASWPGSPMDFDFRRAAGDLTLDIADGTLPEARPGLGRVLGLISLGALPRRLQLDFSDVVGTGFSFDRLKGTFTLADGQATTDDLEIKSPAANIDITGTADLVEQEYDQQIVVRPGLGATLPVIGAIAGGPGGAAVGLALQGLLGGTLRDVGELNYRVTGPWSDPVVEVLHEALER